MKKAIVLLWACLSCSWLFANHWTPNSSPYEENMTLTGVIEINGVEQQSDALEVGVFCGDECRGSALSVPFPPTQRYVIQIIVYGGLGDQFTFKLFDHISNQELDLTPPDAISFAPDGYGTLVDPYVLGFEGNAGVSYYWTPVSAPYEQNMTLTGIVQINGVEQQTDMLEVGVFCGEECRGTGRPSWFAPTQRYILNLVIFGELGNQFTFRLYDHELQQEFDLNSPEAIAFNPNGYGTLPNPYVLNFTETFSFVIAAAANPEEGGTVSGGGTYQSGEVCTLTATANEGYHFVNWTVDGVVVSTETNYSFEVIGSASYVANFALNTYEILVTANPENAGYVEGAGTYAHFSTCTLQAIPYVGYHFVNWTLDGEEVSTEVLISFTVTEAASYVANFALNSYVIAATAMPSNGGTVSGAGTYDHFSTCTLTATANTGYHFVNWTKAGTVVSTTETYSFTVTEAGNYVANFALNLYSVTTAANPTEGGTTTGGGTYLHGTTVTLNATPNEGYTFFNWMRDGEEVSIEATYSFTLTEAAAFVANFTLNSYDITATANPVEGGLVGGAGSYDHFEVCTLTATANEGYAFVNWTEDGSVVSTDETFSFTVTGERSLEANFEEVIVYHYEYNPYLYSDNMAVTGIIQIDGVEQYTKELEVGAFCGNECRGTARPKLITGFDRYFLFLTVFGTNGDVISFRLYDHITGMESEKVCDASLTFMTNAIYGTVSEPYPFNFIDANVTQTANLSAGWNWWSSYIELDGASSLQNFEEALGSNGLMVKSQNNGYASYLAGFGWYGSLTAINNESTYQVHMSQGSDVQMTGSMANPADHPITLYNGWTWIGYPVSTSMSVIEALAGINPQSGDMIKSQNSGYASYLAGFGWYGSLNTLQPGMGLMYKSNNSSTVTLVYPNGGTRNELKADQTSDGNYWQPQLNAYPDNMSVMAMVELDGNELQGENYELAVFANGEVRGSAKLMYVEPLNRYFAFLTVAGDEDATLNFGLYNAETGEVEMQSIESLQYETNAVIGSFAEPYVVSFRGTTGVDEWANNLNVYPNPVQRGQNVTLGFNDVETSEMRVEIINAIGAVVETMQASSVQTITAPETAGVYTLRVTVESKGTCYRKLIVR